MGLYAIKHVEHPWYVSRKGLAYDVGRARKFTVKGEAEAYMAANGYAEAGWQAVAVTPDEMAEAEARAKAVWERERR